MITVLLCGYCLEHNLTGYIIDGVASTSATGGDGDKKAVNSNAKDVELSAHPVTSLGKQHTNTSEQTTSNEAPEKPEEMEISGDCS